MLQLRLDVAAVSDLSILGNHNDGGGFGPMPITTMRRDAIEPGNVIVHGNADGFAQVIAAGPHQLVSDEPTHVGGSDVGPTPYDLLLAALGSCTSMTVAMYARRKGWPLEAVTVRLRHSKIHAADCEACEIKEGRLDYIERSVELTGVLSDDQRARLLDIANKCPVHRTLMSEIHVESRLVPSGTQHSVI